MYEVATNLTGVRDTDILILAKVDRKALAVLPRVSKYFFYLMDDEFWNTAFRKRHHVNPTGCSSKEAYYILPSPRDLILLACKATKYGQIEVVRRVLKLSKKKDKQTRTKIYDMVFNTAIQYENETAFALVVSNEVIDPSIYHNVLFNACIHAERLMVAHILKIRRDNPPLHQIPLEDLMIAAIDGGNVEIVRLLFIEGVDLNYQNGRYLSHSIKRCNVSMVRFLLDPIVNGEKRPGINLSRIVRPLQDQPLTLALISGNREIVRLLLDHQVEVKTYHLFHVLSCPHGVDLIDLFEPDIIFYAKITNNALKITFKEGRLDMVTYLASRDVFKRQNRTRCLEHLLNATTRGHTAIVRLLLSKISYDRSALQDALNKAQDHTHRFIIRLLENAIEKLSD